MCPRIARSTGNSKAMGNTSPAWFKVVKGVIYDILEDTGN